MNPLVGVLLDPEGDALAQSLLALKGSLEVRECWGAMRMMIDRPTDTHAPKTQTQQVQERSTGDVLSILEKVDDRLASLERHMAPIRRVRLRASARSTCSCVSIMTDP